MKTLNKLIWVLAITATVLAMCSCNKPEPKPKVYYLFQTYYKNSPTSVFRYEVKDNSPATIDFYDSSGREKWYGNYLNSTDIEMYVNGIQGIGLKKGDSLIVEILGGDFEYRGKKI